MMPVVSKLGVAKGRLRVAKGQLVANEKSGKCQGISWEIREVRELREKSGKSQGIQEKIREFLEKCVESGKSLGI